MGLFHYNLYYYIIYYFMQNICIKINNLYKIDDGLIITKIILTNNFTLVSEM